MRSLLYIFLFVLISCTQNSKTLPGSTGSTNEIIVVIDDNLWNESYSDLFRSVFEKELIGVSTYETKFKLLQINNFEFNSLLKSHRHIILVNNNPTAFASNKWAMNQVVFNVSTSDSENIFNDLQDVLSGLENFLYLSSRSKLSKSYNSKASNVLESRFLIDAFIPNEYETSLDSVNIFWLSYNPSKKEIIKHLMFFKVDSLDILNPQLIMNKKLFKYIKGPQAGSYVEIEKRYPLSLNDKFYRGLWRLEKGFMGGPLLARIIRNESGTYLMLALAFSPNSPKRNFIQEVEAIL